MNFPVSGPSLKEVLCDLCGSSRSRLLYSRDYTPETRDYLATTDVFTGYGRIVRCLDCSLVYTNPRPGKEELLREYVACVDETYLAEGSSRSMNAHLSLSTIKRFSPSGRLLEIGASVGYFLNAARVDFDVIGLEPSSWACRIARERFKLDVSPGSTDGLSAFPAASFDVVALIDVIEHLDRPSAVLAEVGRVLKPGGLLYIVTPDVSSLSARILRSYWWGFRPAHIHYFDRASLERILAKTGYEPIFSGSFGRIFTYGYWLSRLQHYPKFVYEPLRRAIGLLGFEGKFLYLNTRDTIEICARKR